MAAVSLGPSAIGEAMTRGRWAFACPARIAFAVQRRTRLVW